MEDFGDNFAEVDPAADFLAREQNELAGLEDDLNPATYNPPAEDGLNIVQDASSPGNSEVNSLDPSDWICVSNSSHEISLGEPVKEENLSEPTPKETPVVPENPPAAPAVKPVREEPEKIKKWREEQKKRLEEKDANEEKKKEEWRLAAKKELEEWYRHHEDLITKTKATNRESAVNAEKQFVAEIDAIQPGTEWERISKLCDFNPKSNKSSKDVSRMRSIILQLKQNPKK